MNEASLYYRLRTFINVDTCIIIDDLSLAINILTYTVLSFELLRAQSAPTRNITVNDTDRVRFIYINRIPVAAYDRNIFQDDMTRVIKIDRCGLRILLIMIYFKYPAWWSGIFDPSVFVAFFRDHDAPIIFS